MKLNVSALRAALICGGLLLSVSFTSAQRPRLSKPLPSKQPTAEPQKQKPPTPSLEGTYALTDSTAATTTIKDAIEATVKGMWPIIKGEAREKLEDKNLPPSQRIIISYTDADVTIESEPGTITTPLTACLWTEPSWEKTSESARNGRAKSWSGPSKELRASGLILTASA